MYDLNQARERRMAYLLPLILKVTAETRRGLDLATMHLGRRQ